MDRSDEELLQPERSCHCWFVLQLIAWTETVWSLLLLLLLKNCAAKWFHLKWIKEWSVGGLNLWWLSRISVCVRRHGSTEIREYWENTKMIICDFHRLINVHSSDHLMETLSIRFMRHWHVPVSLHWDDLKRVSSVCDCGYLKYKNGE